MSVIPKWLFQKKTFRNTFGHFFSFILFIFSSFSSSSISSSLIIATPRGATNSGIEVMYRDTVFCFVFCQKKKKTLHVREDQVHNLLEIAPF